MVLWQCGNGALDLCYSEGCSSGVQRENCISGQSGKRWPVKVSVLGTVPWLGMDQKITLVPNKVFDM